MSTPESLNPAPLTGLGDHSYKKVLEDDYSTGKVNLKFKANTANKGSANYKGWLEVKSQKSKQETKFQFPYNKWFVQLATREDGAKLHVDFGQVHKLANGGVNLFANAKLGGTSLGQAVFRFGAVTQSNQYLNHLRFEYNPSNSIVHALTRSAWKKGSWSVVSAEDFQLTGGFGVRRLDFIVGYSQPKYDVFLRHLTENPHQAKELNKLCGGTVALDVVCKNNKQQYGVQTQFNLSSHKVTALVGATTKINDVDVKARVNVLNKTLGLVGKGKLNSKFNWTLSTELPLDGSAPQAQKFFPVPIGFTLDATL